MDPINFSSTNGMLAAMQAFAAASEVNTDSQSLSNNDIASSEFMKQMYQMLNRYNGNTKAIEAFLKSYIVYHTDAQNAGVTGAGLGLQNISQMLQKLQANNKKIDELQKNVDEALNKTVALTDELNSVLKDLGFNNAGDMNNPAVMAKALGNMTAKYLSYGGWLFPPAAIAAAAVEFGMLIAKLKNVADKLGAVGHEISEANLQKSGLE